MPGSSAKEDLPSQLQFQSALAHDILFYGRVVDQDKAPVANARVNYSSDNRSGSQTGPPTGSVATDDDGNFHISGIKGAQLTVWSSKEGYDLCPDFGQGLGSSVRKFEFGLASDGGKRYMDPARREELVLIRKGILEPLVFLESKRHPLKANSGGIRIFLDAPGTGHAVDIFLHLEKEAKPVGGAKEPYEWSYTLRARDGMVAPRIGLNFTAPEEGFTKEATGGYTVPTLGGEWRNGLQRQDYFVRFTDGTHARVLFTLLTESRDSPLFFESWYNPLPTSRQLAPGLGETIRRRAGLAIAE